MISLSKKLIKDIIRYTFFLSLFFWILLSIYVGYQYIWVSSSQVNTKGGTFVEGIFGSTSYLPYLRSDVQSLFYQGLLFNACLKVSYDKDPIEYFPDLCTISTKDNQTYAISLNKGFIWSDGTPLSLEDIYFTYNEILRNNTRKIALLNQYNDITITKEANNTLNIKFPAASKDNMLFFTNYILPKHILANTELQDYKAIFAFKPVYTDCANLVSQSNDEYSLVFNLVNCSQSNLNFYQVKNATSFENFKTPIANGQSSIVDAYIGDETLNGYTNKKILTDNLITLFFNTRSNKLRVRGRRALGGLIKHNFYTTGYQDYFKKNDDGLFDVFQSTGTNIKDLIKREYDDTSVTKDDLLDMNVQILPQTVSINGIEKKLVFYVETGSALPLETSLDKAYDKVVIEYQGKSFYPNYSKENKKIAYIFSTKQKNFGSGLNKYSIYGYEGTKKILIASLDIYNIIPEENVETGYVQTVKLTVIYYSNHINDFVIARLQRIFTEQNIAENFVFEKIKTPQELQGRLVVGDYDLLLNTVDMGLKKDLTKLFSTDKSDINPSQYQNQKLISLLKQYMSPDTKSKKRILADINSIYSKDMPLVILGKEYMNLNLKPTIMNKLFATGTDIYLNEYNRRPYIYKNLKLVTNIHIDGKKVWNFKNFSTFLNNAMTK